MICLTYAQKDYDDNILLAQLWFIGLVWFAVSLPVINIIEPLFKNYLSATMRSILCMEHLWENSDQQATNSLTHARFFIFSVTFDEISVS